MEYEDWVRQYAPIWGSPVNLSRRNDHKGLFFQRFVREGLTGAVGEPLDFLTNDYQITFQGYGCEMPPSLKITSRRFLIPSESHVGTIEELSAYVAKRITRRGLPRLVLNILPDACHAALIRLEDFLDNMFQPITSRVSRCVEEALD